MTRMKGKKHTPDQIVLKLRRAETRMVQGATVAEVCRGLEVSEATTHRWTRRSGAMSSSGAKSWRRRTPG